MTKLSFRLGVSGRLYGLDAVFALGCVVLAAAMIWLQTERAWEAKQQQLEALVDLATGVLESQKTLVDNGVVAEAQARQRALDILTAMRFGKGDYLFVWANTPEVTMLVTGGRKDAIGKIAGTMEEISRFTATIARLSEVLDNRARATVSLFFGER